MSTTDFDFREQGQGPRGWFRDLFPPAPRSADIRPAPDREFTVRHAPSEPIALLGDGDAYSFQVFPTFEWRGMARERDELAAATTPLVDRARRTATHVLRPIARTFEPHRAQEFETAANRRTHGETWTIRDQGCSYGLGISVTVEPDERVQEHLRPYWAAKIKSECDHKLGLQRAHQVEELTRQWSVVLDKLEQDPRTIHAARLSEADFAAVFGTFVAGRQKEVHDLLDLLRSAVTGHNDVGLGPSEFTRAWDGALKAFQRRHGVDVEADD